MKTKEDIVIVEIRNSAQNYAHAYIHLAIQVIQLYSCLMQLKRMSSMNPDLVFYAM